MRVAVIGAGWSGASAARTLADHGVEVEVFEALDVVGGHSRCERLNGVVYEPHGPHIFHTSVAAVAEFVHRFGLARPYTFEPLTQITVDGEEQYFSWPLQVQELARLPQWDKIQRELADRSARPCFDDFEAYCVSTMGRTVYELFIYHYTVKQWAVEPRSLSAAMASQRVHLRTNGDRRLFEDRWVFFGAEGVNPVIDAVLAGLPVHLGAEIRLRDLADVVHRGFDRVICTAALDGFVDDGPALPWRGVEVRPRFAETESVDGTLTPAYMINRPEPEVPYTRTVETKHASGQAIEGTVVCEEYPGHPAKHYPVPTADGRHERRNEELKATIAEQAPLPVHFCGRLANYQYINQDEAILQGMDVAHEILDQR